jgi:autotransporter-associated beta strand protein
MTICAVFKGCVLASFLAMPLQSAPVITEFMAQNESALQDEDGDWSDWIEIHNPTASPLPLAGWHLTDRADNPVMWAFPNVTLAPGAYLIVFASNKDRRVSGQPLHTNFALSAAGEYLGLIAPDGVTVATEFAPAYPPQQTGVSFGGAMQGEWMRLCGKGDPVRYLVPDATTGPALGDSWRERAFDDSGWSAGTLAVGFKVGTNDPLGMRGIFETNTQSLMYNLAGRLSVYLRVPFEIPNPAAIMALETRTQYDDGYAAWLNTGGFAVDAANSPATPVWNSAATAVEVDSNGLSMKVANLNAYLGRLVAGENILAVQGLNANQTSSDLLVAPQVWARVANAQGAPVYGYFEQPSPGTANPGTDAMILFREVTFSEPSRSFTGSLSVTLGGQQAGEQIRMTTDGTRPTASSPIYSGPIAINATTRLRARVFDAAGIGSRTFSRHYLRLSADVAGRQSNLPMIVLDAAGQSLNSTTRQPAYFHVFDRDGTGIAALGRIPDLATRQGLRWRGSSSEGFPKKPYSVEFWDDNDGQIRHPLLGMQSESDWVFYSPYEYDRAYIRNSVAYEMSRRAGRWAPQTRMVEVFYNASGDDLTASDYVGVYAVAEQIKMNTRRLGFETVDPVDVPPPGPIDPAASGTWTGGYLFKIDRTDPDEYDWKTSRGIPSDFSLTLARPKLPDLDGGPYFSNSAALAGSRQVQYLRAYIQAFEDALYSDQSAGFTTRNHLGFIERDAWVDHLLLNAFTKNVDALRLSGFFHKPENSRVLAGPVWDFDRSMDSNDSRDNAIDTWYGTGDSTQYFNRDWWGVLSQDSDFRQAFYDRWAELRAGPFSNAGLADIIQPLGNEVDNSANGLGSAAQRDAARWTQNTPRTGGYPAEVTHMLQWMQNRASWMERRRTDGGLLPAPPSATLSSNPLPVGGTVTLAGTGGTIYHRLDGGDPRAAGGGIAGTAYSGPLTIQGATALIARVRTSGGDWSTPLKLNLLAEDPGPRFLPPADGAWANNANWETNPAAYPNGIGAAAIVGPPGIEDDRSVELSAPVVIGRLWFPQETSARRNRLRGQAVGNPLTFHHNGQAARLDVDGTGNGFVELDILGGVVLNSDLIVDVSNIAGDPEHGGLRMRQGWSGAGGIIKQGPGIASLNGENKIYQGETRIEQGVLAITAPSAMTQSARVDVFDGGQLRLISASTASIPVRDHTFGGPLVLRGAGRGPEVPAASHLGVHGALRYDPGSQDNHARVSTAIDIPAAASIHVEGSRNLLEITGPLTGTGSLSKSGGGTLAFTGSSPALVSPVAIETGTLRVRGRISSSVAATLDTIVDAAGETGALSGDGTLIVDAAVLSTPSLEGLHRRLTLTRPGAPDATTPFDSGNALIIAPAPGAAASFDLLIDDAPAPGDIYQGGLMLPAATAWDGVFANGGPGIWIADPSGTYQALGKSWSPAPGAKVTRVPATLATPAGDVHGRVLEIRFDGQPVTYSDWSAATFPPGADPADTAPNADPGGTGVVNLLYYALGVPAGGNPQSFLPRLSPQANGEPHFRFPYNPGLRDLRWIVQASGDLSNWENAEVLFDSAVSLSVPDADGTIAIPAGEPSATHIRFFRLMLSLSTVP